MYVFARRLTDNSLMALYSAAIYGLWAWFGSIDYFRWGGLPNELAMLLFITMLSIGGSSRGSILAMTICFAADGPGSSSCHGRQFNHSTS